MALSFRESIAIGGIRRRRALLAPCYISLISPPSLKASRLSILSSGRPAAPIDLIDQQLEDNARQWRQIWPTTG
jgi:hypothetical protein